MKIGILSDTHDLLRPEVIRTLEGCEWILHGGDISSRKILDRLEQIAPVKAVRGNNDKEWAEHLPQLLDFELGGLRICMAHKKKIFPEIWARMTLRYAAIPTSMLLPGWNKREKGTPANVHCS